MNKIIQLLIFFMVILTTSHCKSKQKNTKTNNTTETKEMSKKHMISINLTTTQSYCGGAVPTNEMEMELQTPKKLANTTIYIREGLINDWSMPIVAQGVSDENGVVKVELTDGSYSIVFENKADNKEFKNLLELYGEKTIHREAIDEECLKNYMSQPEAVVTVANGKTGSAIIINKHIPCSWNSIPCSGYHGPLPPSAPPRGK
jgi:biopolymer transport protein ExbD